jgi:3-phenylpropionate/trans-cinnamate dioxygenase ferredoxin reductase subunit
MESTVPDEGAQQLVVVGGGQAAAQMIEVARREGFDGKIALLSDEMVPPYQRPPLSKQYLVGTHSPDWLLYRPEHFYEKYKVDLKLGSRVRHIDRTARRVLVEGGTSIPFDKLAIATGSRSRLLDIRGADHPHIYYIRSLADVDGVRSRLKEARTAVIVGAGFIGLEVAAVLVRLGLDVTLLGSTERLLPRLVAGEMASFLLDYHLLKGVKIVLQADVQEVRHLDEGRADVVLADGRSFPADIVLVGIGALPNVELALAAGLDCDNGIVVDEFAVTSDPVIVAAGDCTNHPNPLFGRRLRLETVHNAVEQGRTAGATIAGRELPYIQAPWVWSDQYDLRLQSVGLHDEHDRTVLRGDPRDARFSLFYYQGEKLLAVNSINQPLIFGAVRRLLNEGIPLRPEEAADVGFDLTRLPPPSAKLDFDIAWPIKPVRRQAVLEWGFQ